MQWQLSAVLHRTVLPLVLRPSSRTATKVELIIIFLLEDTKVPHLTFVDLTQQIQDRHTLSQHTNHTGPPAVFLNVIVNVILN